MAGNPVIRTLKEHREELTQLGVASLYVFGSVARGEQMAASDVDVLVDFSGALTFDSYMDLKLRLEEALGRPVDLVTRSSLKPRLRKVVEREAVRVA